MQRLMALHKEVQTHELSTGLSFSQSSVRQVHTHISPGDALGEGQQPAAFPGGCCPLDPWCTEWQQLSQLLLLCAEQSQSRWCSGLIPGAALSNLRNAFWCALPLNCLCHSLNKNSASWISSSSATWLKGSPSSNSSKHYSAGMQKEVLAAPTAVASQHLPGAQVTPSSSISLLKLHHYSYLILSPFCRQPLQKRRCNHFPKSWLELSFERNSSLVSGLLINALLQIHPREELPCKFKSFASLKERKVLFYTVGEELRELAVMGFCGPDLVQQIYGETR